MCILIVWKLQELDQAVLYRYLAILKVRYQELSLRNVNMDSII